VTIVLHNHMTRDLKPKGECPACDVYWDTQEVPVRYMLGIWPDMTGGLSVDEYMDEQRGRGGE